MAPLYLSHERYIVALKRLRGLIAGGLKLKGYDSRDFGAKNTECTWGLCSDAIAAWPDAEDHLWPDQFEKQGRVAPKYRRGAQACPLSREGKTIGCFYDCRFFQEGKKGGPRLTPQHVLALYDMAITKAEGAGPERQFTELHQSEVTTPLGGS